MNEPNEPTREDAAVRRIAQLEARVAKLESRIGLASEALPTAAPPPTKAMAGVGRTEDEFEFEVGQNWFAKVGIVVLTIGAGFMVSLPYASLPAGAPSLIGYALAVVFFTLARIWRQSFELVSGYLRGGAMALLYFATLRLYFFGPRHLLSTGDFTGRTLLVLVVATNLILAYRRKSPWLSGLALVTGYVTAIAIGAAGFVLPAVVLLSALVVAGSLEGNWPGLVLAGIPLSYATYFAWAANNPFLGRPFQLVAEPPIGPGFVLACAMILAAGSLLRRNREKEDDLTNTCALLNCALGYGVFLVHTLVRFGPIFVTAHLAASLVFLGLAVAFWMRERSRVSTFLYAMTGYMALSMAIIRASGVPDVFVWLSLQSVVVVATAIWFRSRFIVVANFIIYAFIVLGYILVAERESGISVGFGIVALLSARILNWQKSRLELKTELMRNAYLLSVLHVATPDGAIPRALSSRAGRLRRSRVGRARAVLLLDESYRAEPEVSLDGPCHTAAHHALPGDRRQQPVRAGVPGAVLPRTGHSAADRVAVVHAFEKTGSAQQ